MNFKNQHAMITGGSSGIGKAVAKILASEGSHISIIARDREKLETTQGEIESVTLSTDQRIVTFSADVSDRRQIEDAVSAAIEHIGPPDVLITSAGIAHPGYFMDVPIGIFERTMAVNYFGTLYSIRAALPAIVKREKGHLVLISSGAGLVGIFGYTPYSPSKFALRGLAESLRGELKPKGIGVSIVYPPDTDTPQLADENKTKPLETKMMTGTAKMWSAEGVAQVIVEGVRKKSFVITPGMEMTLLSRFHSLMTPLTNWYFDRLAAKARRQLGKGVFRVK